MVSVFASVFFGIHSFLFIICYSFLTFYSSLPCFVFFPAFDSLLHPCSLFTSLLYLSISASLLHPSLVFLRLLRRRSVFLSFLFFSLLVLFGPCVSSSSLVNICFFPLHPLCLYFLASPLFGLCFTPYYHHQPVASLLCFCSAYFFPIFVLSLFASSKVNLCFFFPSPPFGHYFLASPQLRLCFDSAWSMPLSSFSHYFRSSLLYFTPVRPRFTASPL